MINESYQKIVTYIKDKVDTAIKEATEKNLNSIDRFAYIMDSYYTAIIEVYDLPNWYRVNPQDNLLNFIPLEIEMHFLDYLDPYFKDVDEEILKIIKRIDETKTVGDLFREVDKLNELLNTPIIDDYCSNFYDLPIHENGIQKKKDLNN